MREWLDAVDGQWGTFVLELIAFPALIVGLLAVVLVVWASLP